MNLQQYDDLLESLNDVVMLAFYIIGLAAFAFPNHVGFQTGVLALLIVIAERSFKQVVGE